MTVTQPAKQAAHERIHDLLHQLYPTENADLAYSQIAALLSSVKPTAPYASDYLSERTATLITYGNTIQQAGELPLVTLRRFLRDHLKGIIDTVHILPFYPYSSDDGFSVIDYFAVDPALGTWADIAALSGDFRLMFDAVINHMSAQSDWFQAFLACDPDFQRVFFTESPDTDLSMITRPRTSPLLTLFQKADGSIAHVWTTFSADQVDLDYRDPHTLIRVLQALLFYVEQGAQVIRLDAIAYLWKEPGTSSIHLPATHHVVQLIRAVFDAVAPHVIIITETNVPHDENVSYFGDGTNEAQLVYNFTLPPLLLHTLIAEDASKLREWVNGLVVPSANTAFFNFVASHDGIGVRPVEGILTPAETQALIEQVERNGGRVSYRANSDGSRTPYELNIAYVDALALPDPALHVRRFLISQGIMVALAGVPAVYIHSLLGSHNNLEGMARTGQNRTINRATLDAVDLETELADPASFRAQVFNAYTHMLDVRTHDAAFHPQGKQNAHAYNHGRVFGLERTSPDSTSRVLVLFNLTGQSQTVQLEVQPEIDMLTGDVCTDKTLTLTAYQMRWLRLHKSL